MKTNLPKEMKKFLPLIFFLLTISVVSAQVKIGDAPKKINPNALLELESQNKGMLIPRMTTAQRDRAFTLDVPNGLMIFNTDEKAVQVWLSDSAQWQSLIVPEDKPQQISLENHILRLSDGGTVDLSPYIDTDTDTDTDDQQVPGIVTSYGSTLAELKVNVQQAYTDYYDLAVELKEDYATKLEATPKFTYLLNLKNIFELLPEVKISNIAEKANINPSLLRQYKTGKAEASEEQAKKVLKAIHQLGEELLSVSF